MPKATMTGYNFKKNIYSLILYISFLQIILGSTFLITGNSEGRDIIDRVVAVVNDEIILMSELNEALNPFVNRIGEYQYSQEQTQQLTNKLREEILNQLINEKLTDQQIKKSGIDISENEVDASIERMKQANRLSDEDLQRVIFEQGLTMDKFREKIRDQILRSKLVSREVKSKIVVTREDIKKFYEEESEKYGETKRYHLRSILMPVPNRGNIQEKKIIEGKMWTIHEKLEQGENFIELAKAHTHPSLAPSGGYLGAFAPETLDSKIRMAVENLKPDEFTPVLDTHQGYQIFFVDKIEFSRKRSLEEASSEIENKLYEEIVDERFNSWLQDLRNRSHIKIIQ